VTAAEQLSAWRAELIDELQTLRDELEAARTEAETAEAAHAAALAANAELRAMAARGVGFIEGMAGSLAGRLDAHRREVLRPAASRRGTALARVRGLQEMIAGRQLGIDQIDRAIAAEVVTELRPATESSRRAHKPVDYDTIVQQEASRRG